jgi:hypothetical protein
MPQRFGRQREYRVAVLRIFRSKGAVLARHGRI